MGYINFSYYQKSLFFLFPLVGISKAVAYKPQNTYMYWEGHDGMDNFELIVHYKHKESDTLFKIFERNHILTNPKLVGCYTVDDGSVYIFDLIHYAEDVAHFLHGEYSEMTYKTKETIVKYAGASLLSNKKVEGFTIHIALCPQHYYKDYALELGYENTKFLEECVELWSIYDKKKETFNKQELATIECCEEKQVMI